MYVKLKNSIKSHTLPPKTSVAFLVCKRNWKYDTFNWAWHPCNHLFIQSMNSKVYFEFIFLDHIYFLFRFLIKTFFFVYYFTLIFIIVQVFCVTRRYSSFRMWFLTIPHNALLIFERDSWSKNVKCFFEIVIRPCSNFKIWFQILNWT